MANLEKYDSFLSTLHGASSSGWTEAQESALLEPYTYITANPGKEIRGKLVESFNLWLNVPKDKLVVINRVVGLLHNASLLVDDIEDDSQLRRGIPVAHKIYGVPQTINTANYVYFLAYQELSALRPTVRRRAPTSSASSDSGLGDDSPAADKSDFPERIIPDYDLDLVVNEELMSLHRGQGMDILWRDTLRCPTEDEYVDMVKAKTGGLLRIAVKLMMACATTNTNVDYIPLTDLIGVHFQIRDDYMNLQSNIYTDNKGFAEDLSEGKFSFPIVHGILENPDNRQIMNVLQKRPKTPTLKHHTINYLRDTTKSFDYTLAVLRKLERQGREEVERLGGNPMLSAILDKLHVDA
ncbi:isoprenoid synthase domain-containing protein [Suillus paluster]|uniref:isoprenoid synthase domain-containing protein n=1 Tax=Suillus paluster TaxID=48578 RepID=UPI001B886362|nr:isoprenoid synthase domain-containing protein [Suillus paluster]KAG1726877.1 isoprenoid synthase domain-containing protein [Suillus paluster]